MEATTADSGDKILSMRQAAEYMGLTIEELYKLHASGIPHHKLGKQNRYLQSELNAWLLGKAPE